MTNPTPGQTECSLETSPCLKGIFVADVVIHHSWMLAASVVIVAFLLMLWEHPASPSSTCWKESSSQRPSLIPSCHTCLKFLKIHGSLSGKRIWGRCFWLGQTTHGHNFVCWHIRPMAWLQAFLTLKIALTVFLVLLWNFQHTKYNLQSRLAYCSGHALLWCDQIHDRPDRGIYRIGLDSMGEATTWEEQLALDMLLRDHAVWLGSL